MNRPDAKDTDDKILLGVLLWAAGAVAEADEKFLPEEGEEIKKVLGSYLDISEEDFPVVLTAIRQAAIQKVDIGQFAVTAEKRLPYETRISMIEGLFRIAWSDRELAGKELEVIKKASDLLKIKEEDFIDIKKKVVGGDA